MRFHLFTTDCSGLQLERGLGPEDEIVAVIVPSNRHCSDKVDKVLQAAEAKKLPVFVHQVRQPLPLDLPAAEAAVSWLYSQIIAASDLIRYPGGLLNMHGGKIPEYRGASVLHWAIVNGESELGITWHEIVEAVDAGPIWYESTIPIPAGATAADMREAMIEAGARAFPEALRRFRSRHPQPRFPDLSGGRVWPSRRPLDGLIAAGWPARRVRDMVRAGCPPWPPALVESENGRVAVRAVAAGPGPGTFAYATAGGQVLHLEIVEDGEAV